MDKLYMHKVKSGIIIGIQFPATSMCCK